MPDWFSIRAAAKPTDPVEILIYDQIGKDWFSNDGVSAKEFADELKKLDSKQEILLSINSPGGNVWDGLAIYNQLHARRQFVTARVDGVAASIASIIALAGRSLEMPENSLLMIHDPSGLCMGDSADMRDMAANLDKHADLLAGIYAGKSGKSREKMRELMGDETWFTAAEAVAIGLADATAEAVQLAACAKFDFSKFRRDPAALFEKPKAGKLESEKVGLGPPAFPLSRFPALQASLQTNSMNKQAIHALLKQHDKSLPDTATDEQILAALADLVANGKLSQADADKLKKPEQKVLVPQSDIDQIRADLRKEKELRLRTEIAALAVERPHLDVDKWLKRVMADETILDDIRGMPAYKDPFATDPIRAGRVENLGNALIERYRAMKAGPERADFAVAHFHQLQDAIESNRITQMMSLPVTEQLRRLHQPRAANTYAAALVTDRLSDAFITTAGTRLAAFKSFSREFETDRLKPRATVQVPKVTGAPATDQNPTNFEATSDSTVTNVAITVNQEIQRFQVSNDDLNKGLRLRTLADKNAQTFANTLSDRWTALLTAANYGTPAGAQIVGASAGFDANDLPGIWALGKNYGFRNLLLDGAYIAGLIPLDRFKFAFGKDAPQTGSFAFDQIDMQNRWTGAVLNTVGFICDPNAIAIGMGLPAELPAGEFIELNTVSIPELMLTIQVEHWFSRATRTHWMAFDIMLGAAAGDTTVAEILVSA